MSPQELFHPSSPPGSGDRVQEPPIRVLEKSFSPRRLWYDVILLVVDLLLLHLSVLACFKLFLADIANPTLHVEAYRSAILPGVLIILPVFTLLNLYNLQKPFTGVDFIFSLGKGLFFSLVLFICFVFFHRDFLQSTYHLPRSIVLGAFFIAFLVLIAWRRFFHLVFQGPFLVRRIVGLGSRPDLEKYVNQMNRLHQQEFLLVEVLEKPTESILRETLAHLDFDEVVDFDRGLEINALWRILFQSSREPDTVLKIMPTRPEMIYGTLHFSRLSDIPVHEIPMYPIRGWNAILKRLFDVVASFCALVILGLPMLLLAFLVKRDSAGPVFYRQDRVGRFGRIFEILKFRSMPENVEKKSGPVIAVFNDQRCTPFGTLLRRWGLDELPQLLLVLKGDMSLVGPRPERPYFIEQNPELGGRRLSVKPGITGLAQVNSRFYLNLTDKLRYDNFYMDNYSIWLDIKICLMTFHVVWNETGKPLE